jgi:uncharacterized YigZ family protein
MKNSEFKTIENHVEAELVEKKSRFIANIFYVESKEEAENLINQTKKKYYDAKHNCFAFSVIENNNTLLKCSDDGEPSGTAGEPILNVIQKNNLNNILIIITRYFGGILLGAGGLVRAYSNSALNALKLATIVEKEIGLEVEVKISYEENEKFKYYCSNNNILITNVEYGENITYNIELNEEEYNKMQMQNESNAERKTFIISESRKICRKYVKKRK